MRKRNMFWIKTLQLLEAKDRAKSAYWFAKKAHKGQKRKFSGAPYFIHPESVANLVKKYTKDDTLVAAAYLHDIIEDTDSTYEDLEYSFGKAVADLVQELTSLDKEEIIKQGGKAKYLTQKMNKMSKDALTIKLCDRLDNVSDEHASESFKERYYAETKYILDNLTQSLDSTQKKIVNAIKEKIGYEA
jgi:GTP pyrophosphokinase